jgi:hypothetical protein
MSCTNATGPAISVLPTQSPPCSPLPAPSPNVNPGVGNQSLRRTEEVKPPAQASSKRWMAVAEVWAI